MNDDSKNTETNNIPNLEMPPSVDSTAPTQTTQPNIQTVHSRPVKKSYKKILLIPTIIIIVALLVSGIALATIVLLKNNLQPATNISPNNDEVKYIENADGEIVRAKPESKPAENVKGESGSRPVTGQGSSSDTNPTQTKNPTEKPSYTPPEKTPTPNQPSTQPLKSPKETWLKSRTELDKAKTFVELFAYMSKHYSKELLAGIPEIKEEVKSVPKELEGVFIGYIRGPLLNEITNVKETTNGNTATLNVETKSTDINNMVVIMLLEDGQWKIGSEDWD